jgi:type IV pilus assembly protein PilC
MAKYKYKILDNQGQRKLGTIDANSLSEAEASLQKQNYTIISVQEDLSERFKQILNQELTGISDNDKIAILTQLYTMISAGISINRTFEILLNQSWKPSIKTKISRIYSLILSGKSLSESFASESGILTPLEINLLRAGEKSGNLVEILKKIKEDSLKTKNFKSKIKGALVYPAIIIVVILVVLFVMIFFMVPQVKSLYASFGENQLPVVTQVLINIGEFFLSPLNVIILVLLIIFIYIIFRYYYKTPEGRLAIDKFILKLPVAGIIIKQYNIANSTKILSMLLSSGVNIIDALDISSKSLYNIYFRSIIEKAKNQIIQGKAFSMGLATFNDVKIGYPEFVIQIIASGEESGNLKSVLDDLGSYFFNEVDQKATNLTKSIEPIMLIIVGVLVAFMAIAIYMPIYQAGNLIGV